MLSIILNIIIIKNNNNNYYYYYYNKPLFGSNMCDGYLCDKLITVINYHLESCLICIVYCPEAPYLLIVIVNSAIVSKT